MIIYAFKSQNIPKSPKLNNKIYMLLHINK